jgi:hypothetical protein
MNIYRERKIPMVILPYSTINEAMGVGEVSPPSSGYPSINYLSIGRGGHRNVLGVDGESITNVQMHGVTDAALFKQIPFLMVPVDNDIPASERAKFRIRKLELHNGIEYFVYYLKTLPQNTNSVELVVIEVRDGKQISEEKYIPSVTSLTPSPVDISNVNANTADGKYIVAKIAIPVVLTLEDINSIKEACTIIYGNENYAMISEFGLIGGYDYDTTSVQGGVTTNYKEVAAAQVMAFLPMEQSLKFQTTEITITFTLDDGLPLPPTSVI